MQTVDAAVEVASLIEAPESALMLAVSLEKLIPIRQYFLWWVFDCAVIIYPMYEHLEQSDHMKRQLW